MSTELDAEQFSSIAKFDDQSVYWLKLQSNELRYLPQATANGFTLHHCSKDYIMLIRGKGRSAATHILGAGAAVINQRRELLLVQEASGMAKGMWGLPGGHVDPGEFVQVAAVREVKEETDLDVDVVDFLLMIENPVAQFGKGNIYMVFLMQMLDETQVVHTCPRELSDHAWVPLDGLKKFASEHPCVGTVLLLNSHFNKLPERQPRFTQTVRPSPTSLTTIAVPRL